MKTCWVVPYPILGSGGHKTIFRHAIYLAKKGFNTDIYVDDVSGVFGKEKRKASLKAEIENSFSVTFPNNVSLKLGWDIDQTAKYNLVIATSWQSVYAVNNYQNTAARKIYFVQDYEAYFNPIGDGYVMAENSYRYGLYPITIGKWLHKKLNTKFGLNAQHFNFGANLNIYKHNEKKRNKNQVCYLYQPDKPRRCPILGTDALSLLKKIRPETEVVLYGSQTNSKLLFEHKNLHLLNEDELSELYNVSSVGLCISTTNPSRIPFEMMACGLPVVDLYLENNLYDHSDKCLLLADTKVENIAMAIKEILDGPELANSLSRNSLDFMKNKNVDTEHKEFFSAVLRILNNYNNNVISDIRKSYNAEPYITKNRNFIFIGLLKDGYRPKNGIGEKFNPIISFLIKKLIILYKSNPIIYNLFRPLIPNKLRYKIKIKL